MKIDNCLPADAAFDAVTLTGHTGRKWACQWPWKNPKAGKIPIAVLIIEDGEGGYKIAVEGYFTKHIDFPQLLEFIQSLLHPSSTTENAVQ